MHFASVLTISVLTAFAAAMPASQSLSPIKREQTVCGVQFDPSNIDNAKFEIQGDNVGATNGGCNKLHVYAADAPYSKIEITNPKCLYCKKWSGENCDGTSFEEARKASGVFGDGDPKFPPNSFTVEPVFKSIQC